MDAPQQKITDKELIEHARGMAVDTATALEDCARRMPTLAFHLYIYAKQLRKLSEEMGRASTPAYPPPTDPTGP